MSTNNVKLGVCNVFFNDQNLGLTKGGVEVDVSTSTHEVKVDQFGETVIGEIITGRKVTVKVPLAEVILDRIAALMPGTILTADGAFSTGTVTFSAAPVNGDSVTIAGVTFTFKTTPVAATDIAIPGTGPLAAQALKDAIMGNLMDVSATVAAAVVTLTANNRGTADNIPLVKSGTSMAVVGMTGGTASTKVRIDVPTGVNANLLTSAGKLRLRPIGTFGSDDFIIPKANVSGSLKYSYSIDNERVFEANFMGYPAPSGTLFSIGQE